MTTFYRLRFPFIAMVIISITLSRIDEVLSSLSVYIQLSKYLAVLFREFTEIRFEPGTLISINKVVQNGYTTHWLKFDTREVPLFHKTSARGKLVIKIMFSPFQ